MIVLTKRAKIIAAAAAFAVIAAAGFFVERYEKDMFIEEIVAEDDAVSYIAPEDTGGENGLININTADEEELAVLYGIGNSLAARIIEFRSENGRFETIEEVMKIPGISENKFEAIKDYICVE